MGAPEQRDEQENPLVKVLVELPKDAGTDGERLWARPLGDDLYEIRNVPWYAYKLNWGDVVRCEGVSPADLPIVREVVERSGHRTLRVFFNERDVSAEEQQAILDGLTSLQSFHERHGSAFLALDVEPQANYDEVFAYLAGKTASETLMFEEAWRWGAESGFGPGTESPQETPSWLDDDTHA